LRTRTLANEETSVGERNRRRRLERGPPDVPLDRLPDEQDLAAAEGPDVVNTLDELAVLEALPNGADVVLDPLGELDGGQIRGHLLPL
jgi:hypothetical protein